MERGSEELRSPSTIQFQTPALFFSSFSSLTYLLFFFFFFCTVLILSDGNIFLSTFLPLVAASRLILIIFMIISLIFSRSASRLLF